MPQNASLEHAQTKKFAQQQKSTFASRATHAPQNYSQLTPTNIPGLQRSIGNQAVQRLLANQGMARGNVVVQPKLKVGAANDRYEAEADRVASQVTMQADYSRLPAQSPAVQRLPMPQVGPEGGNVSRNLEQRIQGSAKGGKPVQPNVRRAVESATGAMR